MMKTVTTALIAIATMVDAPSAAAPLVRRVVDSKKFLVVDEEAFVEAPPAMPCYNETTATTMEDIVGAPFSMGTMVDMAPIWVMEHVPLVVDEMHTALDRFWIDVYDDMTMPVLGNHVGEVYWMHTVSETTICPPQDDTDFESLIEAVFPMVIYFYFYLYFSLLSSKLQLDVENEESEMDEEEAMEEEEVIDVPEEVEEFPAPVFDEPEEPQELDRAPVLTPSKVPLRRSVRIAEKQKKKDSTEATLVRRSSRVAEKKKKKDLAAARDVNGVKVRRSAHVPTRKKKGGIVVTDNNGGKVRRGSAPKDVKGLFAMEENGVKVRRSARNVNKQTQKT